MYVNVYKPWKSLNWPNRITIIRLLLVAPFVILLTNQDTWPHARYAAMAIFAAMAFSDLLDGVLARRLHAHTRLGAILDPLADKVLIICSAVLLSLPQSAPPGLRLSNWIVVFIVGKDLWVILGFLVIYLVTDKFLIHPAKAGKACTVGQLVMVLTFLAGPDLNRLTEQLGSRIALAASWAVAGLCALAVISYTRMGLAFIAQEEKPLENTGHKKNP
jgi:cardiolipin synthase